MGVTAAAVAIVAGWAGLGYVTGGGRGAIAGAIGGPIGLAVESATRKAKMPKLPGMPDVLEEVPEALKLTVEEIEAQERGWEEVLKRAQGRRGTILTEPQLAQIQPYTQRATLLAG